MEAFIWPVRVFYEDTDVGGLVYYANYLKYLERGRTEWLRSLGVGQSELKKELQLIFVVRSVQIDYKKPALLDDQLEIVTRVSDCRGASLVFEQTVRRAAPAEAELCRAVVKIACLHSESLRPQPIPDKIKLELEDVG